MNYFVSCLYGQYGKYLSIIKDLNLKEKDRLWILGDVIDGNEENPGENILLLDAIEKNPKVRLIAGDHEYVRLMQELSDEKDKKKWDQKEAAFAVSGKAFDEYIKGSMTEEQRSHYFLQFLSGIKASESVRIGNKYIYMVHGAPAKYSDDQKEWERKVGFGFPDLNKDYGGLVMGDPQIGGGLLGERITHKRGLVVLCGQLPPERAALMAGQSLLEKGAFYHNGVLAIGRDAVTDPTYVIGIDELGFFIKGKYD